MSNEIEKSDSGSWKLPLYKIYTDDEDVNIITKIIRRGTNWAMGPEILEFETAIKNYVNCDYCITLNSGTSALHATFLAYDLGKNDEIIVKTPSEKKIDRQDYSPRQRHILKILLEKEKVQVADIIKELPDVTKRTIRRDLDDLLKKKKITRLGDYNKVSYSIIS